MYSLTCTRCGAKPPPTSLPRSCTACGGPLTITYDHESVKERLKLGALGGREGGVWKYRDLLPFPENVNPVSLGEGGTYLDRCRRLGEAIGLRKLHLKNESTNPTGSFIDRGTTVVVTKAREHGYMEVSCATRGNLGASLAAYTAKAGLQCKISIPHEIDLNKLYQMIAYGAEVTVKDIFKEVASDAEKEEGREYLLTPEDPYSLEGEKTMIFEVCEQMGGRRPDRIIAPMGSGGLVTSLWKGIRELDEAGWTRGEVLMTGVQIEGCAPIVEAYQENIPSHPRSFPAEILALDLLMENPPYGEEAIKAIRDSNGCALAVTNRELIESAHLLAKTEGIFAEPAAASTVAGLRRLIDEGKIDKGEEIVLIITGAGLKDPVAAKRLAGRMKGMNRLMMRMEERYPTPLGRTKMRILEVLSVGDLHGYGIWKELKERYEADIKIPSVYQHLGELERLGLLRSSRTEVLGRRPRRYCSLTEKGRRMMETYRLNIPRSPL